MPSCLLLPLDACQQGEVEKGGQASIVNIRIACWRGHAGDFRAAFRIPAVVQNKPINSATFSIILSFETFSIELLPMVAQHHGRKLKYHDKRLYQEKGTQPPPPLTFG
jgi:hypothetical protein